jgi:hypothetical protein
MHKARNVEFPPHLHPDGPFLVPITSSIWQPIKICSLCYDHYDEYDLFDHSTNITRSTIIRPAESQQNFRQNKYVEEADEMSTVAGTTVGTPQAKFDANRGDTLAGADPPQNVLQSQRGTEIAMAGFGTKNAEIRAERAVNDEVATEAASDESKDVVRHHSMGSFVSADDLGDLGKLYPNHSN